MNDQQTTTLSDLLKTQADKFDDPALRAAAKKVAQSQAAKRRDELISTSRASPFCRVPLWSFYLPISRRQQLVLGRLFSFQCSTNKDGSQGEFRMSLANGAGELGTDRANFQKDLNRLISLGFVVKRSNGARTPATYLVDEAVCVETAMANGWEPKQ